MPTTVVGDRAVVLGGSVAGLLTAQVLSGAFDRVAVVERDLLSGGEPPGQASENRKGTPQGRHIHGLMPAGQRALEEILPGFLAELEGHGAPVMDQLARARILLGGHRFHRADSGLRVVSASRPLLERCVRQRVRANPKVEIIDGTDVVGIELSTDGSRVTGAHLMPRADGSAAEVLDADLVVDALGRGSRLSHWLKMIGVGMPPEVRIASDVGYASAIARLPREALAGDLAIINGPRPGQPRGGGLAAIEGDRFIVTLMGMVGDHPPTDLAGFMAFARSLEFPDLGEVLDRCELLSPVAGFRIPASVWRRYDRLPALPARLVVVGDALASFNPIYGQGMTVAALEALAVRAQFEREGLRSHALIAALTRQVAPAWKMSASADLAFPGVPGTRTAEVRMVNSYISRVQAAAETDPEVAAAFLRVAGMVDRPEHLLRPAMVGRVLRQGWGTTRGWKRA